MMNIHRFRYVHSLIVLLFQICLINPAKADNCALQLPPRQSNFGFHSLNYVPVFDSVDTCITYEAINEAFLEARNYIAVRFPVEEWTADDIATTGEIVLEVTQILTRRYQLTRGEVANLLPKIDTTKTLISSICPDYVSPIRCIAGKYRRYDGLCNNLVFPSWGATRAVFERLLPPDYADGITIPQRGFEQAGLPNPRMVSSMQHNGPDYHDHAGTLFIVAWGQFMDHDITLTATPFDENMNDPEDCCDRIVKGPYCYEIKIPDNDPFYSRFRVRCQDFHRGQPGQRQDCRLGYRSQFNLLTSVIDGNTVYGGNDRDARVLREFSLGKMKMYNIFAEYGLRELLPLRLDIPDAGCIRPNATDFCFLAGEIRVNEQLILTIMHTLMFREHNRIALELSTINPHWNDETLYQEARRIVIASIQHITYNEFLPIVLGREVVKKFNLELMGEGYWNGYDPATNPSALAEFITAAYRFGHSLLPTKVERWSKVHKFIASRHLATLIRRPFELQKPGVYDEYVIGLLNQLSQAMDETVTEEVINHLFQQPNEPFGFDLPSFNLQRSREFGVPGFMTYRKYCGYPTATTWQGCADLGIFPNLTIIRYTHLYQSPLDIDLWSGGISEIPLSGGMLGPTFSCLIAIQFRRLRSGDRFWYELDNQPSTFTPRQLQELRRVRLARILCDNTDLVETIQIWPMILPDHEINPRVPCKSAILPAIDLTAWAEMPYSGHRKVARSIEGDFLNSTEETKYPLYTRAIKKEIPL